MFAALVLFVPAALAVNLQLSDLDDSDSDPSPVGGVVVYQVTLENSANDIAEDAYVLFDLPPGASATALPAFCSVDPVVRTRVVCALGDMEGTVSGGVPISFPLQIDTSGMGAGTIMLTAAVGQGPDLPAPDTPLGTLQPNDPFFERDTNSSNNIFTESTTLVASGDLALTKTASPNPVTAGSEVTYTIKVTNTGPNASTNFSVFETLPTSVEYVAGSAQGTGWSFDGPNGVFPGTLAVGQSASYTIRGKVTAASGSPQNVAVVDANGTPDPNSDNNAGSATVSIAPGADLQMQKTVSPAPALPGQTVTFTLTVLNNGPSEAENVSFVDPLPDGFVVTGGTEPGGWTCQNEAGDTSRSCRKTDGPLPAGSSQTFTITSVVPMSGPGSSGGQSNTATVNSDTPDPVIANNAGTGEFLVLADGADIHVNKSKSPQVLPIWPGSGQPGASSGYIATSIIRVGNAGPREVTDTLQIVDMLAPGEEYFPSDTSPWVCVAGPYAPPSSRQIVTCDLSPTQLPLLAGEQAPPLRIQSFAHPEADGTTLTNMACGGGSGGSLEPSTGGGPGDQNPGNDCSGSGIRPSPTRADLSISKQTNGTGDADNTLPVSYAAFTYAISVTNQGPDATAGIVVQDPIPGFIPGRTTASATAPPGWTCSLGSSGTLTCRSGTTELAPSSTEQIVIAVNAPVADSAANVAGYCGAAAMPAGAWCNSAGVGIDASIPGSAGEVEPSNNSASDYVRVPRVANVQTTAKQIVGGNTAQVRQEKTYQISYRNEGPSIAPGVVLEDTFFLPADDSGFVLLQASRDGSGPSDCTVATTGGVTVTPVGPEFRYSTIGSSPGTIAISCAPLDMQGGQVNTLTLRVVPSDGPDFSRTLSNVAGFSFSSPSSGSDAQGGFDYNQITTTNDDQKDATLVIGTSSLDLLVNKVDTGFTGGIDPLGYDPTQPGTNLFTYRIRVNNLGPSIATRARITDTIIPLPGKAVEFIGLAAAPSGPFLVGTCTVSGPNPTVGTALAVDCPLPGAGFDTNVPGIINAGAQSTVYLRYRYASPPEPGGDTVNNQVTVISDENETNPANNLANQNTSIRSSADVSVTKSAFRASSPPSPDPSVPLPSPVTQVSLREPFIYVVDGQNNGPGSSLSLDRTGTNPLNGTGTAIIDTLPPGLIVTGTIVWQKVGPSLSIVADEQPNGNGTCALAGSTVTCNVGDLTFNSGNPGRVRILVPGRWDTLPANPVVNTARISTQQVDRVSANSQTQYALNVTASSVEGVVFEDRNRAGANGGTHQGTATEPGIAGVTIALTGTDLYGNAVNLTLVTAADGAYRFENLSPSDASGYTITQTQPAGFVNGPIDPPTSGGDEPSLGGTYAAGSPNSVISAIPVGANQAGVRYNFPEVRHPSLSGFVYVDANFSNVRDGGDSAIAGATVELLNAATGTVITTATTNASGAYSFTNLDPLIVYTLREALPAGNYQNRPTAVNPGLIGGAACVTGCTPGTAVNGDAATTDRISNIDLGAGTDGTAFNFGEDAVAAIGGSVYVDRNGNGDFDAADAGTVNSRPNGGLQGVTVTLTGAGADGIFGNGDDPAPVTLQTDANGAYQFTGLVVGQNYRVTETQPAGYGNGTEHPTNVIDVNALPLAGVTGRDFGETLGSLAGAVFEDFSGTPANNNNGSFDGGENPIANATLTLTGTDLSGTPVNVTVQTNATGAYVFRDLLPPQAGTTYTITETQPTGYIDGRHTPGNAATPGTATTPNVIDGIAISEGQAATGYLFGELANAIISGTVYLDRDDDGGQDAGEPSIPGVTVVIEGAGPDGVFGTPDDLPPVTLTTDANGGYRYGGAITGQNYRIVETQPTGLANGQENPTNTITVTNLPASGSSGNDFGERAASLSGSVWLDADNDGVRDAGENGIAGVSVSLPAGTVDALGNAVAAVVTDANGNYRFDDLLAGTYTVSEQLAQPVVGGVTTINGTTVAGTIGGSASGTATPVATVPSAVAGIVLPAGGASIDNHFGETLGVALSGRVFFDADNDGVQSGAAETGIDGVTITLTGTDDTGAAVSLSTTTDANGDYAFEGLRPGTYTVTEPTQPTGTSNGQTVAGTVGGTPSGTATPITTVPSAISAIDLTTPGASSVGNNFGEIPLNSSIGGRVWRDSDNDGVIDPSEDGIGNVVVRLTGTDLAGNTITREVTTQPDGTYAFIELPPGTYTITEPEQPAGTLNGITNAGNGGGTATPPTSTPSVISGIALGVGQDVTGNDFGEVPAGAISGRVYNDGNNNGVIDTGEGGYANVQVVLTGTDDLGQAVNVTVTTDADGRYRFDDLRPGTYTVTEPTQPPETLNGITSAGTIDGTAVGTATPVTTTPSVISGIVLPPGGESIDNNFGEIGDSPDLVVSKTATPAIFTVNNTATYTLRVRNIGQQPSAGEYVVEDRLPAGLTLAATPVGTGWTCTGAPGDTRFRCASSTVIAAGATSTDTIVASVRVAATAATGSPVNNAVIVEGGGENEFRTPTPDERADFEGNPGDLPVCDPAITQNACRLPTPVQLSASVSGTVWFDQGGDFGRIDSGDRRLSGWVVEVVNGSGQVVGTTTTAVDGTYSITDQVPGIPLDIRFRDPATGVVWGLPVSGDTVAGPPVPCDATNAAANGTASSCRSNDGGSTHLAVVLAPGANLPQQSLPLNPGGVVYDATTRTPVPGSRVTLTPIGTCAGYTPEQHVLNAALGGYTVQGTSVSMTVGAEGFYQFLLGPDAPASCRFQLAVTPPAGYTFESGMIPAETSPLTPPSTPGEGYPVQTNATAPTGPVGTSTTYYLELTLGSSVAVPVHNHIPLDPQIAPGLVITKTGDRKTVEVGDSLVYTITIRQTAGASMGTVNVIDRLPHGFTFIDGTARVDNAGIANPLGKPGPTLVFDVGPLAVGQQKVLTYRVRVGVGSQQGDGINRARAWGCSIDGGCVDPTTLTPYPNGGVVPSNPAEYRVIISGGVFADEGCVLGKIFVDCNVNHVQDKEELGIPGVRMYFEDGTWMVSDSEGKYSYCGLPPKSHTLKVDPSTLPVGSRLTTSSNRNLGDADSLFIDLKNGELHRADFIEGSCSNPVIEQVKARRTQGEIRAPETERNQQPLRFESKPARAPQQGTDSANQRPIVEPRPTTTDGARNGEVQP